MRWIVACAFSSCVVSAVPFARADPSPPVTVCAYKSDPNETAAAQALRYFMTGNARFSAITSEIANGAKEIDPRVRDEAIACFQAAHTCESSPRTRLGLAYAAHLREEYFDAYLHYREIALTAAADGAVREEASRRIKELKEDLKKGSGKLRPLFALPVEIAPAEAVIEIDHNPLLRFDQAHLGDILLPEGKHDFVVMAPCHRPREDHLRVPSDTPLHVALKREKALLRLDGVDAAATVRLDGGSLPADGAVEKGKHEIEITRDGYEETKVPIDIESETCGPVHVAIPALSPLPLLFPPSPWRIVGFTALGAGAAGLVTAAVLFVLASSDASRAKQICLGGDTRCPNDLWPTARPLYERAGDRGAAARGAAVAGAGLGAVGALIAIGTIRRDPTPRRTGVTFGVQLAGAPGLAIGGWF